MRATSTTTAPKVVDRLLRRPAWTPAALTAILLLALALRMVGLEDESLWLDEGTSVRTASLPGSEFWARIARPDTPPPLFHVLLHGWIALFGASEAAVRALPLLFGVFGVGLMYAVGATLFGPRTGLVAAMLLAVSPYQVQFAQEARMYTLMLVLVLGSYWSLIRLLRGQGGALPYVLCSAALLYTHVFGWFVLLAQVVTVGALRWRGHSGLSARRGLVLLSAVLVLFLPWVPILVRQAAAVQEGFWVRPSSLATLSTAYMRYAGSAWLLGVLALLGALGLLALWREGGTSKREGRQHALLLVLWLTVPVLVPLLLSKVLQPFFVSRYGMAAALAGMVLAARGLVSLPGKAVPLGALGIVLLLSGAQLRQDFQTAQKEQWREAAAFIAQEARPGDVVLVHWGVTYTDVFAYYYDRPDVPARPFPANLSNITEDAREELAATTVPYERVWLVLSHSRDRTDRLGAWLNETWEQDLASAFVGIEIQRYRRAPT